MSYQQITQSCRNCRFADDLLFGNVDDLDDEDILDCQWWPEALPLSWEYAPRERMGMKAGTTGCPAFEPKEKTVYYLIEEIYVGPNPLDNLNFGSFEIRTEPEKTVSYPEQTVTTGPVHTINDRFTYAHGEFDTIEAARKKMQLVTAGKYREDPEFYWWEDSTVVERYLDGLYSKLSPAESIDWCSVLRDEITSETPDADIHKTVEEVASLAKVEEGIEIDESAVIDELTEHRDDLLEEKESDED